MNPEFPYTSFSRLEKYVECSQYYYWRYVQRLKPPEEFREALVKGNLVHSILEWVLKPELTSLLGKDSEQDLWGVDPTLSLPEIIYGTVHPYIEELGFEDSERVYEFLWEFGHYLYRASSRCKEDPIRNKDGTVPKDLVNYPPITWSQALKAGGINQTRFDIDNLAGQLAPQFTKLSFSYFLGEVVSLTRFFTVPEWIEKTIAVELPVSTEKKNIVWFPGKEDELAINAKIDWIFKTVEGQLVICDHKTSKSKPTPEQVAHHAQLNLYAVLYYYLYGTWVDLIAIHHVPSGEYVISEFSPAIAQSMLDYLSGIQKSIDAEQFYRRHPNDYHSTCVKRDYKTSEVTETCPFLDRCWKSMHDALLPGDPELIMN